MQFTVKTRSQTEMIDIPASIQDAIEKSDLKEGLCFVFVPHTTAAVTINEISNQHEDQPQPSIPGLPEWFLCQNWFHQSV